MYNYVVNVRIPVDGGRNFMPARRVVQASNPAEARAIAENMYGQCFGVGIATEDKMNNRSHY